MPLRLLRPHRKYGIRRLLRNCKEFPKEEKECLLNDRRKAKKDPGPAAKRTKDTSVTMTVVTTVTVKFIDNYKSVSFTATFDGNWRTVVCVDNCADENIIDSSSMYAMSLAGALCSTKKLARPRMFDMSVNQPDGSPASLTSTSTATTDIKLHIRHGATVVLRGVQWTVTDQCVGEPLLGRPLLIELGLQTCDIFSAAADRHGGIVDVPFLLDSDSGNEHTGCIARVLVWAYHSDGCVDFADLDDNADWLDLGRVYPVEKKAARNEKLEEASENGILDDGPKNSKLSFSNLTTRLSSRSMAVNQLIPNHSKYISNQMKPLYTRSNENTHRKKMSS